MPAPWNYARACNRRWLCARGLPACTATACPLRWEGGASLRTTVFTIDSGLLNSLWNSFSGAMGRRMCFRGPFPLEGADLGRAAVEDMV